MTDDERKFPPCRSVGNHGNAFLPQRTKLNETILEHLTYVREPLAPMPFFTNRHVETIGAALLRRNLGFKYERELLRAPDGGTGEEHLSSPLPMAPSGGAIIFEWSMSLILIVLDEFWHRFSSPQSSSTGPSSRSALWTPVPSTQLARSSSSFPVRDLPLAMMRSVAIISSGNYCACCLTQLLYLSNGIRSRPPAAAPFRHFGMLYDKN